MTAPTTAYPIPVWIIDSQRSIQRPLRMYRSAQPAEIDPAARAAHRVNEAAGCASSWPALQMRHAVNRAPKRQPAANRTLPSRSAIGLRFHPSNLRRLVFNSRGAI